MHDVGFDSVDDPTECERFFEQPYAATFTGERCDLAHTGECCEFSEAFALGTAQHNERFILFRWQPIQRFEELRFGTVLRHRINDIQDFNFTLRNFNFTLRRSNVRFNYQERSLNSPAPMLQATRLGLTKTSLLTIDN